MAYAKLEPSGCIVHKGKIQLRISMFLEPTDPYYEKHHVFVVDETSSEFLSGYKGGLDEMGSPLDPVDYQQWIDSLPHIWRDNPFHNHLIYPDLEASDEDIKEYIKASFDYFSSFHKASWDADKEFIDEWKKVPRPTGVIRKVFAKDESKEASQIRLQDIVPRLSEFDTIHKIAPDIDLPEGRGTIIIGAGATDRANSFSLSFTMFGLENPANADGTIDTFEVWANSDMTGFREGTIFHVSSSWYECRDSVLIGDVTSGSKQTFTLDSGGDPISVAVITGDYAVCYYSSGVIEVDWADGVGVWYKSGEYIDSGDQTSYYLWDTRSISLYGTGEEVAPPAGQPYISRVQGVQGMRSYGGF